MRYLESYFLHIFNDLEIEQVNLNIDSWIKVERKVRANNRSIGNMNISKKNSKTKLNFDVIFPSKEQDKVLDF